MKKIKKVIMKNKKIFFVFVLFYGISTTKGHLMPEKEEEYEKEEED